MRRRTCSIHCRIPVLCRMGRVGSGKGRDRGRGVEGAEGEGVGTEGGEWNVRKVARKERGLGRTEGGKGSSGNFVSLGMCFVFFFIFFAKEVVHRCGSCRHR